MFKPRTSVSLSEFFAGKYQRKYTFKDLDFEKLESFIGIDIGVSYKVHQGLGVLDIITPLGDVLVDERGRTTLIPYDCTIGFAHKKLLDTSVILKRLGMYLEENQRLDVKDIDVQLEIGSKL